jgi:F-type H+-transporting ATPase subunit gamma
LEGNLLKRDFITIGKKGRSFAIFNGNLVADFSDYKEKTEIVSAVNKMLTEGFINGRYDAVYIVYSDFITALTQEPSVKQILPIRKSELSLEKTDTNIEGKRESRQERSTIMQKSFYYEPDPVSVMENLLPYYLEIQLIESLYEAEASEHASRMIAMKNASDNSEELSFGLSLEYNKGRQSLITTEISDITTAQLSLNR